MLKVAVGDGRLHLGEEHTFRFVVWGRNPRRAILVLAPGLQENKQYLHALIQAVAVLSARLCHAAVSGAATLLQQAGGLQRKANKLLLFAAPCHLGRQRSSESFYGSDLLP